MADRVFGSQLKIERADQHLRDLESRIRMWFATKPHAVTTKDDAETGDQLYHVQISSVPPADLSLIVGDVVHNLRSSLDLLMWQLVEANGQTPTKSTEFPIAEDRATFESARIRRKVEGVSNYVLQALALLKPYQGGNDGLWQLHELDIEDKHRLLLPTGSAHQSITIKPPAGLPGFSLKPKEIVFPMYHDMVILRVAAAARPKPETDFEFTFDVALGKPASLKGEPLIPALWNLSNLTQSVIDSFRPFL